MVRHLFVLSLFHPECAWATTIAAWSQRAPSDVMSALQQQSRAVAPPGDGTSSAVPRNTHIGEWGLKPPLGLGNATGSEAQTSQERAGQGDLLRRPIQTVIQRKQNASVQLCVSMAGYLQGGLANSVGVVNMVMDFAIRNKLSFVMPQILPIGHDLGDDFAFMFGSNPVCANRTVPVWPASCPSSSLLGKNPPHGQLPHSDGCNVSEQWVHDAHKDTTSACGCDEFVLVETKAMAWSYDYSRTAATLSRMYWRNAAGTHSHSGALKFPLLTAMHVRLGDVVELGSPKELPGETYKELAMALTSFINAACLDVSILTDGRASDRHVVEPKHAWVRAGARSTQVLDLTTPANVSLNTLARADILIGGPSGFPRLAAVLGNAQVKLFVDERGNKHPIQYLPGVSEVALENVTASSVNLAARQALEQNGRVAEVAAACTTWLARKSSD